MFEFSKNSEKALSTCHPDIQSVLQLALTRSQVDFGISEGHRSVSRQKELYAQGRTKPGDIVTNVDGEKVKSNHNYNPSNAVDIYVWTGKLSYDVKHLCYVAGVIMACAAELGVELTWGGNWDGDGIIISDQKFQDLPHYERK